MKASSPTLYTRFLNIIYPILHCTVQLYSSTVQLEATRAFVGLIRVLVMAFCSESILQSEGVSK